MNAGKLSGSFVGGKATRRTYRYEASYQREGNALSYSSRVWCEGSLRAEPHGTIRSPGSDQNDDLIRRQIRASIERLSNMDSRLTFARRRKAGR
ncbi:MAG TPA: hypothetical protein VMK05_08550 [Burkholderiales bacterium]|nr:hypothetical protein [Burkholderiales bacterium]